MMFDSFSLKHRPDQTVYKLNEITDILNGMRKSIRVVSNDSKHIIIIGEGHPTDPNTDKPYPFGIRKYRVLGDRLELESEIL